MPTRSGLSVVAGGIGCFVAARLFGIFELYIVGAALIGLVACSIAWVVLNWRALSVSREISPSRLHAGSASSVQLLISNRRLLPTPVARITDSVAGKVLADAHVPPLSRRNEVKASYRLPTDRRGNIPVGPMRSYVSDAFGLARVRRLSAPDASVLVLPRVDAVHPAPLPGGDMAPLPDLRPGRVGLSGEEFSALRAYAIGDDLRKVHWPSSARTGQLTVRTEHVPEHGSTRIVLDVRESVATAATFELMVSAAASVLIACHGRGDHLEFATTADTVMHASSTREVDLILDRLAVIDQVDSTATVTRNTRINTSTNVAVHILGNDSSPARSPSSRTAPGSSVVALFGERTPTDPDNEAELRSVQMIVVGLGDSFAEEWNAVVTRRKGGPRR